MSDFAVYWQSSKLTLAGTSTMLLLLERTQLFYFFRERLQYFVYCI